MYNVSKSNINRELIGSASSHNRVLYFQRIIEYTKNDVIPEIILQLYDAYWETIIESMELFQGVYKFLEKIKSKGYKVAIVTDLTAHIQLRKIVKLGLTHLVDVVVTSEEAGSEKPHPYVFPLTLNKLKLLSEEVVMIGDSLDRDVLGANSVNIDTIHFNPLGEEYSFAEDDMRKPNYVVRDFVQLSKMFGV